MIWDSLRKVSHLGKRVLYLPREPDGIPKLVVIWSEFDVIAPAEIELKDVLLRIVGFAGGVV